MPVDPQDTPHVTQAREETAVSERLGALEDAETEERAMLGKLLEKAIETNGLLGQLVGFAEAKDAREQAALEIERERREASAEAQAKRIDADTNERRTNSAWLRTQAERLITPFSAFIGVVLTGIGMLIIGYLSGRFGVPVPAVAP